VRRLLIGLPRVEADRIVDMRASKSQAPSASNVSSSLRLLKGFPLQGDASVAREVCE
jgi:hypothetical protein